MYYRRQLLNILYSLRPHGITNILENIRESIANPPLGIPEIGLQDFINNITLKNNSQNLMTIYYRSVHGSLPIYDQISLCTLLLSLPTVNNILEIGTYHGHTARLLAINAPKSHVYTIDLPLIYDKKIEDNMSSQDIDIVKRRELGSAFLYSHEHDRITQLFGDSRFFDYKSICPEFDFIFIDGCHDLEFVAADTKSALSVLKWNGILAWHDCSTSHPGVINVVKRLAKFGAVKFKKSSIAFLIKKSDSIIF